MLNLELNITPDRVEMTIGDGEPFLLETTWEEIISPLIAKLEAASAFCSAGGTGKIILGEVGEKVHL